MQLWQLARVMRVSSVRLLIGCLLLLPMTSLSAQALPRLSSVALKRIAEAVDGVRTGRDVYVALSGDSVIGAFENRGTAAQVATRTRGVVVGPFTTVLESTKFVACTHVQHSSAMRPDLCVDPPSRKGRVVGLSLVVVREGGVRDSVALPPESDAVFLSMAAIDKFAMPYYLRTLGATALSTMRRDFLNRFATR